MTKLDKLYRKAPQLDSPAKLDDRVLRVARSRVPQTAASSSKKSQSTPHWRRVGYAVSYLCIFGIGFGVLLQAGFFPAGPNKESSDVSSSASDTVSTSNIVLRDENNNLQREGVVAERSVVATEESQMQTSESAQLVQVSPAESMDMDTTINTAREDAASVESIAAADTTAAMSAPQVASGAVVEFSKSLPQPESLTESLSPSVAISDRNTVADAETEFASVDSVAKINSANIQSRIQKDVNEQSLQSEGFDKSAMTTRSIEWLLSQSPDRYTVKVASDNAANILTLLGNELSIATELVQITDGVNGWMLLHGSFSNRSSAEQIIPELFAAAYSAKSAVDAVDSYIKLEVISFAALNQLLK